MAWVTGHGYLCTFLSALQIWYLTRWLLSALWIQHPMKWLLEWRQGSVKQFAIWMPVPALRCHSEPEGTNHCPSNIPHTAYVWLSTFQSMKQKVLICLSLAACPMVLILAAATIEPKQIKGSLRHGYSKPTSTIGMRENTCRIKYEHINVNNGQINMLFKLYSYAWMIPSSSLVNNCELSISKEK